MAYCLKMKPIVILMGVCGSGKSTLGRLLAKRTDGVFIEGDDFHPPENITKMRSGIPLSDDDRAEWLVSLSRQIQQADERPHFVSCSALKESYRELLNLSCPERLKFVLLHGSKDLLKERLELRENHYMPPELLDSQLDALEISEELLQLDISKSPEELGNHVLTLIADPIK